MSDKVAEQLAIACEELRKAVAEKDAALVRLEVECNTYWREKSVYEDERDAARKDVKRLRSALKKAAKKLNRMKFGLDIVGEVGAVVKQMEQEARE